MSDQSTDKPQSQQTTPAVTQQPKESGYQPNRNIESPEFQISTEGYDPRADITRKDKNG
ncbi:MAG: hypothetical protein HZA65_09395 [Rhodocyclales bacterium]|nr:hypothetical protein [Rhodocyclales bacterium]